jgi:NADH-quinone oxidoreductase subunit G
VSNDEKKAAAPTPPPAAPSKPQPKNPGFVTFTVDGKEVVAKPGTNMMEAVKQVGVEVPYYCYHPRLSVAANCRMCMVEVSNSPKLVPACQTPISEGLAVKTTTEKVAAQQKAVMEFLLLEHPVDCSICDQAGECKLQDYYMRYDFQPSRLTGEKVMKNKRKELGPEVVLDQERCVMCTRCVRFMKEVANEPQLGVFGRGKHEVIDTFPGQKLDSNYSVNTVDVCPVGALTYKDFRFRARSWFLSAAPSVCTGCSRGCNTWADFFGQDTYRYRPRENEAVNQSWMCNEGRLTYKALNEARVEKNTTGRGPEALVVTAQEAATAVAEKLKGASGVAVLASAALSNESLLAGLAFAKDALKAKAVYVGGRPSGKGDAFLMREDKNPNRKGLEAIARAYGLELKPFEELEKALDGNKVKALFAVGTEVPTDEAAFAKKAAKLELFVAVAQNASAVTAEATHLLGAVSHVEDEGTFTQGDGITQRFRRAYPARGDAQPVWKWISGLRAALGLEGSYGSSREAWKAHAASVPEFKEFNWDKMAPIAQRKPGTGINPLPTGSDGRPAGFREFNARPENAAAVVKGESR